MNILIVSTRLCYGGAERVGVMLANGLAQNGHQVSIVANLHNEISYHTETNVKLINSHPKSGNKIQKLIGSLRRIRRAIKQERPDVVIGIMWSCSLKAKIACRGMHIPVVSTMHDSFEHPASAPMSWSERMIKFQLNKIYPAVTVLTNRDKELAAYHLNNVHVMPNPLAIPPVEMVPPKEKIILAAGRLADWHVKGFDILIQAWAKLAARYPEWHLHIAGKDEHQGLQLLQDLCRQYGVEQQVKFLGFRQDIQRLYRDAEIFVLSSRYEGFGLVLIEAMSQGCACVAADYKGRQRDIITNEDEGVICAPESIDALAQGIERLLENETYRRQVQERSIETSKQFLPTTIISNWETLLSSLIIA